MSSYLSHVPPAVLRLRREAMRRAVRDREYHAMLMDEPDLHTRLMAREFVLAAERKLAAYQATTQELAIKGREIALAINPATRAQVAYRGER